MSVSVWPTLRPMAEIYALPRAGGEGSARFRSYLDACRHGALLHGFNPMTNKPVVPAIESLLAFDAEEVARRAGTETVARLSVDDDVTLFLSVAAPGMWTDRVASDVAHRLAPRHLGEVLLWCDETQTPATVRSAAIEQTVRAVWWQRVTSVRPSLAEVARREGLAAMMAGRAATRSAAAAEVLEVLGDDRSHGTATAFIFGDEAAIQLGYVALDLTAGEGLRHAAAEAGRRHARDAARAFDG